MANGPSSVLRRAGAAALLGGGLVLISHPGFTAPRARKPVPRPPQGAGVRNLPKPPSARPAKPLPQPTVPPGPAPTGEILPVSQVRAGMKGYGLTVFHGTKIERFGVEVLGVLERVNMGRPLILVRLSGGPISERGAYLIQGMSGSPIYIDGKLLGAFSMGNAWPKEPIGMVTPIEDMMEALDPKLSEVPAGATAEEIRLDDPVPASAGTGLFQPPAALAGVSYAGQSFRPLSVPLSVSGISGRNLERMAKILEPYNLVPMQGAGGSRHDFKAELTPGAAIGVALMTGDVEMTGIGTVTYRKGDQVLAFGHPMMQIGAAQFPITTAWIHDVFPGFQVSHKIGSPGELCGTLIQDRPFSIAGRVGPLPRMIPVKYSVTDRSTGRSKTYNVQCANHPLLVGQLLPIAVNQGLFNIRPVPGDAFAKVTMKLETEGAGTITRENVFFDPAQIDIAAVRELMEVMMLLSNNSFRRVPVKSLEMDVTLIEKRPTATIERVFLTQERFKPGDEVDLGIILRPYRQDPVTVKTKIRIPANAADGRAVLMVQGGATRVDLSALMAGGAPGTVPGLPPPDASLRQVLRRFIERERNNQLVARLVFTSAAVNINGERLSQLPGTIVDVMRSSKATGFRIERDEAKTLLDTEYLVTGLQALPLTVAKENHQEKPSSGSSGGSPSPATGTPITRPGTVTLDSGDDLEGLFAPRGDVLRFEVDGKPVTLRLTPELEEKEEKEEKTGKDAKPSSRGASASDQKKPAAAPGAKPGGTASSSSGSSAAASSESKLVGRQAVIWTQTSQADFERGKFKNSAVSTQGEVRLTPHLRLAHESDEQFVWSVVALNGAVYAGTGHGGLVLKVDAENKSSVFFRTGELEVHALAKDAAGNLYAGTSPNGKIFRIGADGKGTELFSMNGGEAAAEAGSKYILSMTTAPDGTVYAGSGPSGKVYRIRDGKVEEFCGLPDRAVMSLVAGPDGTIYAGTDDAGAIYRIRPDGSHSVVYDTDQTAVTGLALDQKGNLYAATAPSGTIYRIEPDGTPRVHFNKSKGALYDLRADGTGTLYACSANTLLRIEADGTATLLADPDRAQFLAMAWDESGRLVAGSGNVGSIYRVDAAGKGEFESTIHDAKLPAKWGRLRFTGALPPDGKLTVQTRSGNVPEPDATWSAWAEPRSGQGGLFVASPPARFLQYRVLFEATSGSPTLKEISISYLPRNQAPTLALSAPVGGEILRGKQTLKWTASDPDKDTLTFELAYSGDGGRTWKPLGETAASTAAPAAPAKPADSRASANEALKRYQEELDKDLSLTPQQREENLAKARALVDQYLKEQASEGKGKPETAKSADKPAESKTSGTNGTTREATFSWDTKQVSDGIYVLRIVASDAASNPSEPLTITKVSEPFIVSNEPPQLFLFEKGIEVKDGKAAVVGFAAGRVALKGAQYRIGTGDWVAIDSEDGIWDSAFEHFRFTVSPDNKGEHTLEVKVVDAAGNPQTQKVKFKTE